MHNGSAGLPWPEINEIDVPVRQDIVPHTTMHAGR